MKKTLSAFLAVLVAVFMLTMPFVPLPAQGVTGVTTGVAKVGNIILGGTTLTATGKEINSLSDEVATVDTVATAATGSNGAQFTFKNAAGSKVSTAKTMLCYVSTSAGAIATSVTSLAALTNGQADNLATGSVSLVHTTADGLLGITTTAAATGTYYLSFPLPNGKVITSSGLTVN